MLEYLNASRYTLTDDAGLGNEGIIRLRMMLVGMMRSLLLESHWEPDFDASTVRMARGRASEYF